MPSLQIRDLPAPVHKMLAERAKKERRSIAQEATMLLTEALTFPSNRERRRNLIEQMRQRRRKFDLNTMAKPEDLIREDRDR